MTSEVTTLMNAKNGKSGMDFRTVECLFQKNLPDFQHSYTWVGI